MVAEIPRRANRRSVQMTAQCRTTSGLRDVGQISDISAQGCCIRTRAVMFRVGSHVVIRPEGMEALGGTVRWVAGDYAGLEFDRPIYSAVLDHLAQMHAAGAEVAVSRE